LLNKNKNNSNSDLNAAVVFAVVAFAAVVVAEANQFKTLVGDNCITH